MGQCSSINSLKLEHSLHLLQERVVALEAREFPVEDRLTLRAEGHPESAVKKVLPVDSVGKCTCDHSLKLESSLRILQESVQNLQDRVVALEAAPKASVEEEKKIPAGHSKSVVEAPTATSEVAQTTPIQQDVVLSVKVAPRDFLKTGQFCVLENLGILAGVAPLDKNTLGGIGMTVMARNERTAKECGLWIKTHTHQDQVEYIAYWNPKAYTTENDWKEGDKLTILSIPNPNRVATVARRRAIGGTGWNRPGVDSQLGKGGLVGHYWASLEIELELRDTVAICAVWTDSPPDKLPYSISFLDDSTEEWNVLESNCFGIKIFDQEKNAKLWRIRWESTDLKHTRGLCTARDTGGFHVELLTQPKVTPVLMNNAYVTGSHVASKSSPQQPQQSTKTDHPQVDPAATTAAQKTPPPGSSHAVSTVLKIDFTDSENYTWVENQQVETVQDYVYERVECCTAHIAVQHHANSDVTAQLFDIVPNDVAFGLDLSDSTLLRKGCGNYPHNVFFGVCKLPLVILAQQIRSCRVVFTATRDAPTSESHIFHMGRNCWDRHFTLSFLHDARVRFRVCPNHDAPHHGWEKRRHIETTTRFRQGPGEEPTRRHELTAVLCGNGQIRLYVNGTLESEGFGLDGAAVQGYDRKPADCMYVGRWHRPDQSFPLSNRISELELYDGELQYP